MELRSVRIVALGFVGLAAALLFEQVAVYVLTAMALAPLLLLVAGQFYLPRSKHAIQVWFNPIVIEFEGEQFSVDPGTPVGRLSGKELTYSYFKQWHEFEIMSCRHWLLGAIGVFCLGSVWLVWRAKDALFYGIGFLYLACSVWVMPFLLARRWLWERRTLRHTGLSIGSFSSQASETQPYQKHIRYHFVDPEGEYRGGMLDSMFCDPTDDMTIVFFNEANPDLSVPASAMIFHKLVWKEKPAAPATGTLDDTASEGNTGAGQVS